MHSSIIEYLIIFPLNVKKTTIAQDGHAQYVLNWDVARYPATVGVHPGDQIIFVYEDNHNVFQMMTEQVCS